MSSSRDFMNDDQSVAEVHCWNKRFCSQKITRGVILAAICLSVFGPAFCIFLPAAIEHTIISVMRIDVTQFELFYSFFYWPNIVLLLIGGVLVDKVLGLRVGYLLSLLLSCVGQLSIALGGFFDQYWLMIMGRFILGTGSFMVVLTVEVFLAHLFRDQLSLAFSFVYCLNYISKTINFGLNQLLYNTLRQHISSSKTCLGLVLLFGFTLCTISLLSGVIAATIDYKTRTEETPANKSKLSMREILNIPLSFWIYILIPLLYYAGQTPFISIAQTFIIQKYAFSSVSASLVNGLIYCIPAITLPVFGCVIHQTGYKMCWAMLAVLLILVGQCIYCFSGPESYFPYISTIALGLSLLLFCCTAWTFGLLLVKQQIVATAYGIAFTLYNISETGSTSLIGVIVDNFGYFPAQLFICSTASLCLLALTALYIVDSVYGSGELNKPGWSSRRPTPSSAS